MISPKNSPNCNQIVTQEQSLLALSQKLFVYIIYIEYICRNFHCHEYNCFNQPIYTQKIN